MHARLAIGPERVATWLILPVVICLSRDFEGKREVLLKQAPSLEPARFEATPSNCLDIPLRAWYRLLGESLADTSVKVEGMVIIQVPGTMGSQALRANRLCVQFTD